MKSLLFAFSYNSEPTENLPGVSEELTNLDKALDSIRTICSPQIVWQPQPLRLMELLSKFGDNMPIFHFSGHAGSHFLQFNKDQENVKNIFGKFFAAYIGIKSKGLRLVFLNGCATHDLAQAFLDNGAAAVIATNKPLKDIYGLNFAFHFYKEFFGNQASLQTAFDAANTSFKTDNPNTIDEDGRLQDSVFHEGVRGIGRMGLLESDDKTLYTLHFGADKTVANQKFTDWLETVNPHHLIAKTEPAKVQSKGKHPDSFLLCNRNKEVKNFSTVCDKKLKGELPEVQFFFIHESALNMPEGLSIRFKQFLLPQAYQTSAHFEELPLPEPQDFGEGDPLSIDKFKIRLSEIYKERFGGTAAEANRLATLNRRGSEVGILVIRHILNVKTWSDKDDDTRDALLKDQIKQLLDWYIGEYAQELQRDFCERLVVIIEAKYLMPNAVFPVLLKEVGDKYLKPEHNIAKLRAIDVDDVDEWQTAVWGDEKTSLISAQSLFDALENGVYEQPIDKIKGKMIEQIIQYNRNFAHV
jgi:CHAT domain-containing protein